ncbi:serine/threonine-protein kinase nekl-2-like isoform X2 [Phymastichus coffea]|uniref:serine/threonine-protein kinase nekl-2-like isoform X2 n=1 Tax=Phymastichus coffea TaxID=108790 RepID=UPI00273B6F2C|nr:serine/threonine-protein kinase nekl-2-like isoform X2 [Phymastichus coffea]
MNLTLKTEDFDFKVLLGEGTFGKVYLVKRLKDEKQFVIKKQVQNGENAWNNKDSLYLFAQILLGVHHIHSKNILHRDLKPENIMLTGRMGDIVKIGDFGLSRDLQEYNLSHAGSYYYVAPEMLRKQPYDFKSDVWSMGVVLYEMLTKELAFPASNIEEIVQMICREKPRLFQSTNISRSTKIIVYKILQQDASMRPSTRLLLLCPYLVSYTTKVYLNLGRSYAIPDHEFKLDIFRQFLKPSSAS